MIECFRKFMLFLSKRFLFPRYVRHIKNTCQVNENEIVFMSRPDYSDNALAFYEYLKSDERFSNYKIYWAVSSNCKEGKEFENVKLYRNSGLISYKSLKLIMCAKYLFSTHDFVFPKSKSLQGQVYVMLWHGCGYKDKPSKTTSHNFDWACVPGPLFVKTKAKSWNVSESKFIAKGYPRYDWMLQKSESAERMALRIKGNSLQKLVIWMPTFRNSVVNKNTQENAITQFPLMRDAESWDRLDLYCEKRGIKLLIKLHAVQKSYDIDFSKLKMISLLTNSDFNCYGVQMYQFLAYSDALISDYSSIAVDYLILDKPIAFALDDFEQYKKLRGFVFDDPRKYMPGHHMYSQEDLFAFLDDVANGADPYKDARKQMMCECLYLSTSYCKDLADNLGL